MRFLVTGGGGFIGSNLALTLENYGHDVVVLDNFSSGNTGNLMNFGGEVISESILTIELDRFSNIDAIFHCAAITDTTLKDKDLMLKVNVAGFKRFLEFAVSRGKKFIYSSSAGVYGNTVAPTTEDMAGQPLNIYGISKWEADCMAMKYMKQSNSPHIIGLRYFNVFGPGEQFKGRMASMVWQLTQQMWQGKRPRIFKWGEQSRDQVYVKDVVRANILGLDAKISTIVNVGTGYSISFNYIIEVLNQQLGTRLAPEYFDNPYTDSYQEHTQAGLKLAKEVLDYEPEWDFESAVKDYINNIKAQMSDLMVNI